jgi:KaiC/GvpD/RAD55 family RecA-like ATPase
MKLNPYNSTKPGNLFTGYEKLGQRILNGLSNGKSFAVMGGRRCGKTSLLLQSGHRQFRTANLIAAFRRYSG